VAAAAARAPRRLGKGDAALFLRNGKELRPLFPLALAAAKAIVFVTGVPGAGKTLVGLNVATRHDEGQVTHRAAI
jgi:hypothetical protein